MANTLTAYVPEIWSMKGVSLLREKIVMPNLVNTDFSTDVAQYGDVVNTRQVSKMTAGTVDPTTGVSVMNIEATNIQVTLNNHKHVTFRVTDREASKSFKNIVDEFIDPAMLALANDIDSALLGRYTDLSIGAISVGSAGGWKNGVNSARTRLNKNKVPVAQRYLVLSDDDEGMLSNTDILQKVNESGTTTTLREGEVGRFKGFQVFRASNVVGVGSPTVTRKNMAFHRDCFALVIRTLSPAKGVTPGAVQSVSVDPDAGLSLRMTLSYNATLLATQVTFDVLYGTATLDEYKGVLINSTAT